MCGIAGILGRIGPENRAALARMSAALAHRGPDGEGTWESPPDDAGQGVLLAHRRLAILDLSEAGRQPMVDPASGHVLVFNGEIYNFRDLRRGLEAEGQRFDSTGDTAVLLRALALRGREALPALRGMFAFAAWDPRARSLLLARDPLGIKPLYVARNPDRGGDWTVAFASELRALLASGILGRAQLDPRAVASVVWNGFVAGPHTAVRGVELLAPGHLVEYAASGARRASADFWTPPQAAGPAASEAEVEDALRTSVGLHLESDVPLAVFLSSGVDSSAVANLAQRAARAPVHTFTLSFEAADAGLDEGPYARRIAAAIGTEHHEVVLTEKDFVEGLDAALDSLDQPSFDGLNAYYLSRAIRDAGFKVALVGTGGDELFGGYPTFRQLPRLHAIAAKAEWIPRRLQVAAARAATSGLRLGRGAVPPQTRWAKLPEMVERSGDLLALYQLAYAMFLPAFQRELLLPGFAEPLGDGLPAPMRDRLLRELATSRSAVGAIALLEQRLFLGERLLRDNDAVSMAVSLEQRVPLVDRVLFEAVGRLPDATRFEPLGRKALLRRIGLAGLDPALFERPKTGFVLPFQRWIREGLRASMDETLRDPAAVSAAGLAPRAVERLWRAFLDGAPGVYWSRVWALYVLVRWCQRQGLVRA